MHMAWHMIVNGDLRQPCVKMQNNGIDVRITHSLRVSLYVTDRPVEFDSKAKVGALVQRACTFKKQKLAEEAEEEALGDQQVLARAVSTRQYAIVRRTGSVTGRGPRDGIT
jgi:hypothetical protein